MKTSSRRILSPKHAGLAVCAALLLAAPNADAGSHDGADWYLLSREGKLIRKLDWKDRDVVDTAAGLIYRLNEEVLDAFGFDGLKRWSVRCPVRNVHDGTLVLSAEETLVILADGILYGYAKRTGEPLYRTPLGTPLRLFGLARNYSPPFSWGIKANGEDGQFFYLTRQRTETVRHDGGRMEEIAVQGPALAKFGLASGRELWETVFATNIVVGLVSPGVLEGGTHSVHFDPETGHLLTNVSPTQVLYAGATGFCLSTGKTSTLTAMETGTQRILWKLKDLQGVRAILEPYAHDRLLCATDSRVKIVDTAKRRVQAEFPLAGLNYAQFLQTKRVVIAQSALERRAVNPETGATLWKEEFGHARFPALAMDGDYTVVTVEGNWRRKEQGNELFEVVALAAETGAVEWRWQVPDGPWGDSVGVTMQRCPGGIAVSRSWFVGE